MHTYEDIRREIVRFSKETGISPYDIQRVSKDMCCCGKCKHFMPHYLADGKLTDFGHCTKNKIPKAVRPREISCGYWDGGEENGKTD